MKLKFIAFYFLIVASVSKAQINCETAFVSDTMSVPEKGEILKGHYLEVQLKDFSVVRLFRTNDDKYFIRFIVKQNFYFNKTGVLEIRSGSKSYYVKNTKQYKVDKTTGMFVVEVFKNYITTLKQEGMTSIYFADSETKFTRQDAKHIKQLSECLYASIQQKK
jgi:hypothetical protein